MSAYLDPSVLVSLIVPDINTAAARLFLEISGQPVVVSDFGVLEVASALGIKVRTNKITAVAAREGFADLRVWLLRHAYEAEVRSEDVVYSEIALARFDLNLRAPDALHIAVASRLGAALATFDGRQAASATILGLAVNRL